MRTSELRDLARIYSIDTSYTDATGRKRTASKDALVAAIQQRAGVPVSEARSALHVQPVIEPVIVAWGTSRPTFEVRLAPGTAVEWDVAVEDGSWRSGRATVDGGMLTLDAPLPHGYHTLRIADSESLIIAAPTKASPPQKKTWGVFAPLYAAHTRRSWGAGDLGDLLAYGGWLAENGGGVVATLPMLAAFDDEPSPYSPVSRLFWNELYLDVTRLPEFDASDADAGAIAHLQQTREVDHAAVRREKRRVLERCCDRFRGGHEFDEFAERAQEYADFRARVEQRDSSRYHLYVQYRLAQQMRQVANAARRRGAGLYLDFPLGVNPAGYDASRYRHLFASGVSVGAPPDAFFTKGQNWGFPPFDPDAVRQERYQYFRDAIRHHVSHAGILRIDHVMGLHRLYWIPNGSDASNGVYVRYRQDEMYAILVLESRRHACAVVGEDLGTVPPEVPKKMARHGLRQMYVVQYELKPEEKPLPDPPAASIASINTHDMPTFAAFWSGKDIEDRLEQDLLDERGAHEEGEMREKMRRALVEFLVARGHLTSGPTDQTQKVMHALLTFLASSDAEVVLVNLEDLWCELSPQNMPGVPEKSWKQKFRMALEDVEADGTVRRLLASVEQQRARALLRKSPSGSGEAATSKDEKTAKEG